MLPVACGAVVITLSAWQVATNSASVAHVLPSFVIAAVGTGLALWGGSRLRRAKADLPDLTWIQFLRDDLMSLGIALGSTAVFLAQPPEQRDGLMRSVREFIDLWHLARGGP
jgi:hypothetical protein